MVAYVAWFIVVNANKLEAVVSRVSYETSAETNAAVLESLVTQLYSAFTAALVAGILLWIEQNICFTRIGLVTAKLK